jgi:hypothetical protein
MGPKSGRIGQTKASSINKKAHYTGGGKHARKPKGSKAKSSSQQPSYSVVLPLALSSNPNDKFHIVTPAVSVLVSPSMEDGNKEKLVSSAAAKNYGGECPKATLHSEGPLISSNSLELTRGSSMCSLLMLFLSLNAIFSAKYFASQGETKDTKNEQKA